MVFFGHSKVVVPFEGIGFDEETVSDIRNQWVGGGSFDSGMHSFDLETIGKCAGGGGIRIRNQFPQGMGVLVSFEIRGGDEFDGSDFESPVKDKIKEPWGILWRASRRRVTEGGGVDANRMRNVNNLRGKGVSKKVQVKADYRNQGNGEDDNVLFGHIAAVIDA
jgi:hypothetical protein